MSRSITSSLVTLVLFMTLCPPIWGQQEEPKTQNADNQNTVKVHSVTMLEDRTGKICFEISVKDPTQEIPINLDNVTDLKMVEDSMDVTPKEKQFGYSFEGKLLKLKLSQGDYLLEYVDTTITFTAPQYKVELQEKGTNSKISGNLTVMNGTCYPWLQNTKIKLVKENQVHTLIASLQARHEPKANIYLPFEEKTITNKIAQYTVSISEFEDKRAHPSLVVDFKQAWPQSPVYYQLPGKIKVCVDSISWSNEFEADEFTSITTNPKRSLFESKTLLVTRSDSGDAVLALDDTDKKILKSKFHADYDYEFNSNSIPTVTLEVPPKSKIDLESGKPKKIIHITTLPELNLLIETEDPLLELAPKLNSIQKELTKLINLTVTANNNFSRQASITEQEKHLEKLNYLSNLLHTNDQLSFLLDLKNQIQTSITAEKQQQTPIDLKKVFPKVADFPVLYVLSKSSDFSNSIRETQKKNVPILVHLSWIAMNATKISSLVKTIPTEESYQAILRRLASQGDHDADVTLLRKQRIEQMKLAKNFTQIYNALVLDSAEVFPIPIPSTQTNQQVNSGPGLPDFSDLKVESTQQ